MVRYVGTVRLRFLRLVRYVGTVRSSQWGTWQRCPESDFSDSDSTPAPKKLSPSPLLLLVVVAKSDSDSCYTLKQEMGTWHALQFRYTIHIIWHEFDSNPDSNSTPAPVHLKIFNSNSTPAPAKINQLRLQKFSTPVCGHLCYTPKDKVNRTLRQGSENSGLWE